MPLYLKQSTASQEIPLGYFVDSTDGNTEETALSIANTDIKIWKTGATTLANKNSGGATHISNGVYYCVLDATDTDTVGSLVVFVHVSGALAVRVECVVLPSVVYDSLIGGTDTLQVDVTQFSGTNATASGGRPEVNTSHIAGSAVSTTTAQIGVNVVQVSGDSVAADNLEAAADGTGYNLGGGSIVAASVTGNVGGSVASVAAGGITASSIAADAIGASELAADAVAEIADAVWDEVLSGHLTAGTTGNALNAAGSAGDPWSTTLPGSYTGSQAGKMLSDILTDTAEIGSAGAGLTALASAANLATLTAYVDTEVATIVTQTSAASIRTAVGLASANLDTQLSTIDTVVDSILDDTGTSGVALAAGSITAAVIATGAIDADSLAADAVAEIWGTALTEAYRGTGATGTGAQLLYELIAHMGESSIASTTKTLRKLDGSTTAKTYTLDSATTPTSITETT